MANVSKECLFVAFINLEKAYYDTVGRRKLFDVM